MAANVSSRSGASTIASFKPLVLLTLIAPVGLIVSLLGADAARADTIYLKNGNHIPDCKVISEDEVFVSVRTPSGDMTIPREQIVRIQRVKTVADRYKEELEKIHPRDYRRLYELALWCRKTYGLRKESNDLLEKVVELRGDHAPTRKLLGHLQVDGKWVVPQPLKLQLKVSGVKEEDLRSKLQVLLDQRSDVQLAPPKNDRNEKKGKKADQESIDPLQYCTLDTRVIIAKRAGSKFFGQQVNRGSLTATVTVQASSPWVGRKSIKSAAAGEVPGNTGTPALALQNALGRGSFVLHKFFDQLVSERLRHVQVQLEKEAKAAKTQSESDSQKESTSTSGS